MQQITEIACRGPNVLSYLDASREATVADIRNAATAEGPDASLEAAAADSPDASRETTVVDSREAATADSPGAGREAAAADSPDASREAAAADSPVLQV